VFQGEDSFTAIETFLIFIAIAANISFILTPILKPLYCRWTSDVKKIYVCWASTTEILHNRRNAEEIPFISYRNFYLVTNGSK